MDEEKGGSNSLAKNVLKEIVRRRIIRGISFSLTGFVTIFVVGMLIVAAVVGSILGGGGSGSYVDEEDTGIANGNKNLSPAVLSKQSIVEKYCREEGIPQLVPYILAIMMVESGGNPPDVMQSSESQGHAPGTFADDDTSIKFGVKYFKTCWEAAETLGNDPLTAVQSYNFGSAFNTFIAANGQKTTMASAEKYSLEVVVPSMRKAGYSNAGSRYRHVTEISQSYNGGYLYLHGGNFFYHAYVDQYLTYPEAGGGGSGGGTRAEFLKLAIKQEGKAYAWGAEGPDTFDCSGLVLWALKQLGIDYPHYTGDQWGRVQRISESQLKPGDLIFYGVNASAHVSIYVSPGVCFEAKSPSEGIGYGNYKAAGNICGYGRISELTDKPSRGKNKDKNKGKKDKNYVLPITNPQVTSEYGYRSSPLSGASELHNAIDLVNGNPNTPVMATMSGTVVEASGKYFGWYGNYVVIQHNNGKFSGYAHLSSISCRVGQKVSQGQQIGLMGTTGPSTGPHLHFQIGTYHGGGGGSWENPRNYLQF